MAYFPKKKKKKKKICSAGPKKVCFLCKGKGEVDLIPPPIFSGLAMLSSQQYSPHGKLSYGRGCVHVSAQADACCVSHVCRIVPVHLRVIGDCGKKMDREVKA